MKIQRIGSLVAGVVSVILSITYLMVAILLLINMSGVVEAIENGSGGTKGLEFIAEAGIMYLVTVFVVVIVVALCLFRLVVAYYFYKCTVSEEQKYNEIKKSAFGFSFLAIVMVVIFCFLTSIIKSVQAFGFLALPFLVFMILYIIVAVSPVANIIIGMIKKGTSNKEQIKEDVSEDQLLVEQATEENYETIEQVEEIAEEKIETKEHNLDKEDKI